VPESHRCSVDIAPCQQASDLALEVHRNIEPRYRNAHHRKKQLFARKSTSHYFWEKATE
jgi:hypothetical protein